MWDVIYQRSLLIREPNEVRILRLVRDSGEISRVEIAKIIKLHKASIGDHVAKLIEAGFLEETGKEETTRSVGRKRRLLRFRPMAGLVAGVDIRKTSSTIALTDLNARILRQETITYPIERGAQEVLAQIAECIQNMLAVPEYAQSKLVGIGIGVQGVIDYETNTLVLYHNKRAWQGESLGAMLEQRFAVPVYVENDVKTMTLGEYLFGAAKGAKDLIHIWIGDGIGAGIMINGHLHHGITASAGEIGYNGLEFASHYKELYPLMYREQKMFGEILTDATMLESYMIHSNRTGESEPTIGGMAREAEAGDEIARQIIGECMSMLSALSISMVNTLNPEKIVLGGELVQHYPAVADMLQQNIRRDLLAPPAEAVRVVPAANGGNGVILGAIGLVLYELFEPLHSVSIRSRRFENGFLSRFAAGE